MSGWRRWFPWSRTRSVVALDVGVSTVRSLRVRSDSSHLVLEGFRVARVQAGLGIAAACREALALRAGGEPVAVSATNPDAVVRKIELPPMSPEELLQALPWEARRQIAGLAEDAVLDAQVLNAGSDSGPMEVLLVAYPRAHYETLAEILSAVGVDPVFVDVRQLATLNATVWRGPAVSRNPVALLDLGSTVGTFAIFSRSDLVLLRDLSPRVAQLNAVLFRSLGLDDTGLDILRATGRLPDGTTPPSAALHDALAEVVSELVEDLRSGLVYLENRSGLALERVYLAGGTASLLERFDLTTPIAAESGLLLERFDPFVTMRHRAVDEVALKANASELCAAAGTAMRYFGATTSGT